MVSASLGERLQLAPLTSLASAMGINDRVRFATELFDGDMSAFNEACKAIEAAGNEQAAQQLLIDSAEQGIDWEAETGAARDFSTLVTRLFL